MGLVAFLVVAGACAPFDEPMRLGPVDGVLGRPDGPAAALARTSAGTLATWAMIDDEGTQVAYAQLPSRRRETPRPTALTTPSTVRRHPPRAFARPDGSASIAWRETSGTARGRLLVAEAAPDAPPGVARALPGQFGSDPRGGGTPLALIAVAGALPTPRTATATPLRTWQRRTGAAAEWTEVGAMRARARGFAAHGVGARRVVTATVEDSRGLTLTLWDDEAPPRRTRMDTRPAGPAAPWLASAGPALLAGWSEWTPGLEAPAVHLARSTDRGATWTSPKRIWSAPEGTAPMAHFDADGRTVAIVWVRGERTATRIALAISTDAGASFAPAQDVDDGTPAGRARPRVAVARDHVLVSWQERGPTGATHIRASASRDLGATLSLRAEVVADGSPDRDVRNPQPWLDEPGVGGVSWESVERPTLTLPSAKTGPDRVTLHARTLRR